MSVATTKDVELLQQDGGAPVGPYGISAAKLNELNTVSSPAARRGPDSGRPGAC
jgi:hypothetical protein